MDSVAIPPIELIPANYFAPLDLSQIFAQIAPLEIDLGCGDGAFLVALAERFPERNFLGIERLRGRVRRACQKATRQNLPNVRVLRVESSYAIRYLLPAGSVEVAHLLFPDPWPKKRHHRRRIVTADFLSAVHQMLAPGGRLCIATDQEDYFRVMQQLVLTERFSEEEVRARPLFPLTTFEKHFVAKGAPVHRLELRKVF